MKVENQNRLQNKMGAYRDSPRQVGELQLLQ